VTRAPADNQPRWLSILVTLGLAALSVFMSVVLTFAIVTYAYAFAGHQVSSWDQLYMLGTGPSAAVASAWLPGLIASLAGLVVLFTPGHRHAWMFPGAGIALGLVLVIASCMTFQQPPPMTGG
jgi:hypothetical protein